MRVLGVDWGSARIGIAVGESEFKVATARQPLKASGKLQTDAQAIVALANKESAEAVVVGLPYEEDGTAGKMVRLCTMLAEQITLQGCTVFTVDESGSTHAAESNLRLNEDLKASERRKQRDGEAACIILDRFFYGQEGL